MSDYIRTFDKDFRELGPDHFIWLPLRAVPIVEMHPINSLAQPALSVFKLVEWNAIGKFATDNQKYLGELASGHNEMGYFLLHDKDEFGIIGVEEYDNGRKPGRATIFNARKIGYNEDNRKVRATRLKIIYSSQKYPFRDVIYEKGDIAYWQSIHIDDDAWSCAFSDD